MTADRHRPTPSPMPPCFAHSGFKARLGELERDAEKAAKEREEMKRDIVAIKVTIAKWVGGSAALLAALQIILRIVGH